MNYSFEPLSKLSIARNIDTLIELSKTIPFDNWILDNYLLDLPFKWEFSFIVYNNKGVIIGFVVSSLRNKCLHINRIVISKFYQNKGIGADLLNTLIDIAKKQSINNITLKVHVDNLKAINWYKKYKFKVIHEAEKDYLLMQYALI